MILRSEEFFLQITNPPAQIWQINHWIIWHLIIFLQITNPPAQIWQLNHWIIWHLIIWHLDHLCWPVQNWREFMSVTMASDVNDGIVIADKHFVGIWHVRSVFKSAANIRNVSNIDTWKRNDRESNPRPLSRGSNALTITPQDHCELWKIYSAHGRCSAEKRWEIKLSLHLSSRYSTVCSWHQKRPQDFG